MPKMIRPAALAAAALLAACAPKEGEGRQQPELVPAGDPINCVEIRNIRDTTVRSDSVIDFRMRDGTILRNTLPMSCPGLGFARAFSYSTSISRLCSVDTITVIQQGGGPVRGATCGLGQFVPHKPVPAPAPAG
jgi:hypothetical protein